MMCDALRGRVNTSFMNSPDFTAFYPGYRNCRWQSVYACFLIFTAIAIRIKLMPVSSSKYSANGVLFSI